MKRIERLLKNPPSERVGLYTIGDAKLSVYNREHEQDIHKIMAQQNTDFCCAVDQLGAGLGVINSKMQIHSTAG